MPKLQSLTPLRGIAALFVVFHHYSAYLLPDLGKQVALYSQIWLNSYLWVDFFFMLSGFLLAHVYSGQFESGVRSGYFKFLLARFARIYPLHIFMLALFVGFEFVCVALVTYAPLPVGSPMEYTPFADKHSIPALIGNIVLLQGVLQGTSWNQPAWSISAEWLVYLIFPFLASIFVFKGTYKSFFVYMVCLIGLYLLIELTRGDLDMFGWPAIIRALLEFVMGMVLYSYYKRERPVRLFQTSTLLVVSLCGTLLVLHLDLHDIVAIPMLSLLVLSASQSRGWLADMINSRPLVWLGDISYSIYMMHWLLYIVCTRLWLHWAQTPFAENLSIAASFAVLGLFVVILLLLSSLSYARVEVPFRFYLKNSSLLVRFTGNLNR